MNKFYADEATASIGSDINIAAELATKGVRTTIDESGEIPNVIIEQKKAEVSPPPEATKTETATAQKVEEVNTAPAVNQTQTENISSTSDWRQELKKADITDILKELGYDDKMVGFYNQWRTGGDLTQYLRAATIDYSKYSPEQLLRQQLLEMHPEFSPEDFEELYRAKVIDHYKLDPEQYSEAEVKRGKIVLQADAKEIRESLMTKQKEYILSAKPPQLPDYQKEIAEQAQQQEDANKRVVELYRNALESHPSTKELMNSRLMKVGEGDDSMNYEVADPNKALAILQDPREWARNVFNEDGSPQIEKQLFLAAAAMDHKALAREIFKAGRQFGSKQAIEQIENAKKPDAATATGQTPLSPVEALAKHGVVVNSD